jgi:hypothetical protein
MSDINYARASDTDSKASSMKNMADKVIERGDGKLCGSIEGNKIKLARLSSMKAESLSNRKSNAEAEKDFSLDPEDRPSQQVIRGGMSSFRSKREYVEENDNFRLFDFSAKPLNSQAALNKKVQPKPKMFIQSR